MDCESEPADADLGRENMRLKVHAILSEWLKDWPLKSAY